MQTHILTVTQLTRQIKNLLEGAFPDVWVEGEISNLRAPQSGHTYFTLKDEESQIRAVLFRSSQKKPQVHPPARHAGHLPRQGQRL